MNIVGRERKKAPLHTNDPFTFKKIVPMYEWNILGYDDPTLNVWRREKLEKDMKKLEVGRKKERNSKNRAL